MSDSPRKPKPATFEEFFEAFQRIEEIGEVRYVIGRNFNEFYYSVQVLPRVKEGFESFLETGRSPLEPLQKAWARLEPKLGAVLTLRSPRRRTVRIGLSSPRSFGSVTPTSGE